MPTLEQSGLLTVVEHLIAKGARRGASSLHARRGNTWAAEREVINVFLELYLTAPPSPVSALAADQEGARSARAGASWRRR